MGCCSKKGCGQNREEMLSAETLTTLLGDGSWVIGKLFEIAKGGARFVGFKNERLDELAALISAIVAENNYLKSLLGIFYPGNATTSAAGVTISFGPRNEYTLFIPAVTEDARAKLGASLIAAGEQLKQSKTLETDSQQFLPFSA